MNTLAGLEKRSNVNDPLITTVRLDLHSRTYGNEDNERTVVSQKTDSGTIQVPVLQSFRAGIPEIVIPQGMSLLVAFPGAEIPPAWCPDFKSGESYGAFLLITLYAVEEGESMPHYTPAVPPCCYIDGCVEP